MQRLVGFYCVAIAFGLSVDAYAANNLVPNGSFEQGGPGEARFPAGWKIEKGPPECFRLSSDRPIESGDGWREVALRQAFFCRTELRTETLR